MYELLKRVEEIHNARLEIDTDKGHEMEQYKICFRFIQDFIC